MNTRRQFLIRAPLGVNPLPKFNPPRRVPHGVTILGRLFDDGLIGQVGLALERAFGVAGGGRPGSKQARSGYAVFPTIPMAPSP